MIVDFVHEVGVELLAVIIVEFLSRPFKQEAQEAQPADQKKELFLKREGDTEELYAANYSAEELELILRVASLNGGRG